MTWINDAISGTKIATRVKLLPPPEQAAALECTLRTVNDAANWVSGVAFERGVPREYGLRKHAGAGPDASEVVLRAARVEFEGLVQEADGEEGLSHVDGAGGGLEDFVQVVSRGAVGSAFSPGCSGFLREFVDQAAGRCLAGGAM
ncbi:hypothetical protein ACFXJ5_34990 [Streptomyces sp. NPDC059373]